MTPDPRAAPAWRETAALTVAALVAVYAVSQFLRNSVGVIAPDLSRDMGLSGTEIGLLSSAFFFAFAAAQIPVGIAIDRHGPKRTLVATTALAIAGTLLFALAPSPGILVLARMLMGLGCSTFLMAPLAIYAQRFPPERFAVLTSWQMGFANLGTLAATAPLAAASGAVGWRTSFLVVAGVTALIAILFALVVPADRSPGSGRERLRDALRGVGRATRVPSFWPVFAAHLTGYSSFATVVGLWAGPWLSDVHGADLALRGNLILVGAAAQIVGLFAWGLVDRRVGSFRKPVLVGGGISVLTLGVAALVPMSLAGAVLWLAAFGFVVAYVPTLTAHGRALFPRDIVGRGITLMNIGAIGGTFLSQSATGFIIDLVGRGPDGRYPPAAFQAVFGALALWLLISLVVYARAGDPHPSHARNA